MAKGYKKRTPTDPVMAQGIAKAVSDIFKALSLSLSLALLAWNSVYRFSGPMILLLLCIAIANAVFASIAFLLTFNILREEFHLWSVILVAAAIALTFFFALPAVFTALAKA